MIPLVKQEPGSGQCLAACVAMITRTSVASIIGVYGLKHDPIHNVSYFTLYNATRRLLEDGWIYGMSIKGLGRVTEEVLGGVSVNIRDCPALVAVDSPNYPPPFLHSVVWCPDRRMILDPLKDEPQDVRQYRVQEWTPLTRIPREK